MKEEIKKIADDYQMALNSSNAWKKALAKTNVKMAYDAIRSTLDKTEQKEFAAMIAAIEDAERKARYAANAAKASAANASHVRYAWTCDEATLEEAKAYARGEIRAYAKTDKTEEEKNRQLDACKTLDEVLDLFADATAREIMRKIEGKAKLEKIA